MKLKTVLLALAGFSALWAGEWLTSVTHARSYPVPWYSFPLFMTEFSVVGTLLALAVHSTGPTRK